MALSADTAQNRVLVVDDEPNIVDVISMALRFTPSCSATATSCGRC